MGRESSTSFSDWLIWEGGSKSRDLLFFLFSVWRWLPLCWLWVVLGPRLQSWSCRWDFHVRGSRMPRSLLETVWFRLWWGLMVDLSMVILEPWYGIHGFWVWIWPCCSYYRLVFLSLVPCPCHSLGQVGLFLVCDVVPLRCSFRFSWCTPRLACTLAVWRLRSLCRRVGDCGRGHSWSRGRECRFRERYFLVRVVFEFYSRSSDYQGAIAGSRFWSLFGGCICGACEFAICAASRKIVVHGAFYVPRDRMCLGV